MASTLQFPPKNDPFERDVPVWMAFYVAEYSTFNKNRTRAAVKNGAFGKILIPYPKEHATLNSQNYTAGGSLNVQSVETGSLLGTLAQQITGTKELFNSFLSGGSVIRFDHFETILEPGARRTHAFNINFMAKTKAQAEAANAIALTFQANMYPIAGTQSLLTMNHPPLWYFEAVVPNGSGYGVPYAPALYWDGHPLVSVLKNVDINRSPIINTPFTTSDFRPLAINVKLTFIELEPAMAPGDGSANIISRSERFTQTGRPRTS